MAIADMPTYRATDLFPARRIGPIEHQVFMVRVWRASPNGPWEYVLHRSGSDEIEHFNSAAELFAAFERKLEGERSDDHHQTPQPS
jgi:hypothetical protein